MTPPPHRDDPPGAAMGLKLIRLALQNLGPTVVRKHFSPWGDGRFLSLIERKAWARSRGPNPKKGNPSQNKSNGKPKEMRGLQGRYRWNGGGRDGHLPHLKLRLATSRGIGVWLPSAFTNQPSVLAGVSTCQWWAKQGQLLSPSARCGCMVMQRAHAWWIST